MVGQAFSLRGAFSPALLSLRKDRLKPVRRLKDCPTTPGPQAEGLPLVARLPDCYHCPMAARRILQLGDPLLRSVSLTIALRDVDEVLRELEDTLAEFRRTHGFGRAISAIQIGAAARVIFMHVDGVRYELINPEIAWRSLDLFELWDDCFSFPNLMVRLQRHTCVRLTHENRDGSTAVIEAAGALAELIQHEMDHLDGVLAVDRALDRNSLCTREEWLRQIRPA